MEKSYKAEKIFDLFTSFKGLLEFKRRTMDISRRTFMEIYILGLLIHEKGVTQAGLVDSLKMPKQTVNSIVSDLIEGGYIESSLCPDDRRQKNLTLTKKGRDRAEELTRPLVEMDEKIYDLLGEEKIAGMLSDCDLLFQAIDQVKEV